MSPTKENKLKTINKVLSEIVENRKPNMADDIDEKILVGMAIPKSMISKVVESFEMEDEFIRKNRGICLWFILIIVFTCFVTIILLTLFSVFKELNLAALIASLVTLLIEIIGLLTIVFKYLFNRKENKVLDILRDIIKSVIESDNKK